MFSIKYEEMLMRAIIHENHIRVAKEDGNPSYTSYTYQNVDIILGSFFAFTFMEAFRYLFLNKIL